jgi:hypothetical protein
MELRVWSDLMCSQQRRFEVRRAQLGLCGVRLLRVLSDAHHQRGVISYGWNEVHDNIEKRNTDPETVAGDEAFAVHVSLAVPANTGPSLLVAC